MDKLSPMSRLMDKLSPNSNVNPIKLNTVKLNITLSVRLREITVNKRDLVGLIKKHLIMRCFMRL